MLKSQEQSIDKVSSSIESVSQSMDASSKEEERQSSVKASEQASIAASASKEEASRQAALSQQASSGNQVVTDESPKIIGNINTKVYHTPDQAGYRMNAANATYFDNESQAIANGYRKSKR